jgi:EmrB/QacA subfamily drug resistance transporter
VATIMPLSTSAILLTSGRLADIFGRKKLFAIGTVVLTVATLLCGVASSPIMLIICRAFQGIGGATTFSNAVAILTSVFPAEERGKAIGWTLGSTYLGASAGPFLGGVLTQYLGWRSIFFLTVVLWIVVLVVLFWKLKGEWAEARGEKFDLTGAVIFGISLVLAMYGFTELLTLPGIIMVALGLAGMVIFVRWERRVASPILEMGLFRGNRVFTFSNLATIINYTAAFAVLFYMSLYLQYIKGFNPQTAGMIMLVQSVSMTIGAPISGRLSDRVDPAIVASAGLGLNCLSLVMFIFLDAASPMVYVVFGLVIFGVGMGVFASPNSNAVMGAVQPRFLGVASAMVGTMRNTGMMLSMAIAMVIFSVYLGDAEITPDLYPAFLTSARIGYIIFTGLCICGILAQLAGRRKRDVAVNR